MGVLAAEYRSRAWKHELQKFADDTALRLCVSHFPPGTRKWNNRGGRDGLRRSACLWRLQRRADADPARAVARHP